MSYDEEERRFTGRCTGSKACQCKKCCGDRTVVTVPKAVLNYERRCMRWCKPGITTAGSVQILGTDIGPGERDIVASDLIDMRCTNSLANITLKAEYEIDARCAARTITRAIYCIDHTGAFWSGEMGEMLCDGTATVEVNGEVTLYDAGELFNTTINAEIIDISTGLVDGAIPLVVSNTPTLPSTITVEVDVEVVMGLEA